jgi:hypothetical protein
VYVITPLAPVTDETDADIPMVFGDAEPLMRTVVPTLPVAEISVDELPEFTVNV